MPSGPGRVEPERSERGDDAGDDAQSPSKWRLRDPVLVALVGVRTVLRTVDALYRRFEQLPGWIRFGFGVSSFLASAYAGDVVTDVVEGFVRAIVAPVVGDLLGLSVGIQAVLLLLAIVTVQTTGISQRTKAIQREFSTEGMDANGDFAPDGGRAYRTIHTLESGRSGVLGGVAAGIAFGANFGWGGILGGAILGAIVGDEIEKWYVRQRKKREIASFVIQSLLREGVESPDSVPVERLRSWFPSRDADLVDEVLADLTSGEDAPLVRIGDGTVGLTDANDAETYLREELDLITLPR